MKMKILFTTTIKLNNLQHYDNPLQKKNFLYKKVKALNISEKHSK